MSEVWRVWENRVPIRLQLAGVGHWGVVSEHGVTASAGESDAAGHRLARRRTDAHAGPTPTRTGNPAGRRRLPSTDSHLNGLTTPFRPYAPA